MPGSAGGSGPVVRGSGRPCARRSTFKEDQVLVVDLGGNEGAARDSATVLGPGLPEGESGVVVI